jgi:VanZ family protein
MKAQKEIVMKLSQYKFNIIPIIYTFIVLILLLSPATIWKEKTQYTGKITHSIINTFAYYDKLTHFLIYYIMVILFYMLFSWRNRLKTGIIVAFTCSILTESLQAVLPTGRQAEWLDFVANIAGITIAALTIKIVLKIRSKKKQGATTSPHNHH